MLARRSLYCSKHAKGAHSVAKTFSSDEGNIWFKRTKHTWKDGKCLYCGASRETFDRDKNLETMPMSSFIQITLRHVSVRYLEVLCSSTSSLVIRHIN